MNDFYVDEDGIVRNRAEELEKKKQQEKEELFEQKVDNEELEEKIKKEEAASKAEALRKKEEEEKEKQQKEREKRSKELAAKKKAEEKLKEETSDIEEVSEEIKSDPEEKKAVFILVLIIAAVFLTISFIISLSNKKQSKKSANSDLEYIMINGAPIEEFENSTLYYEIRINTDEVKLTCKTVDSKASISGCVDQMVYAGEEVDVKIRVKSEIGSTKVYTVNLVHEKPKSVKIVSVSGVPDNYISYNATLTINASGNLAAAPYSFDGGATWTSNPSKTFYEKTSVKIRVKGTNGDITGQNVLVKIDKTVPSIKLVNHKSRAVEAIITPAVPTSSYSIIWYINGRKHPDLISRTVPVKESGTYRIVVKTAAGRSSEASINVY